MNSQRALALSSYKEIEGKRFRRKFIKFPLAGAVIWRRDGVVNFSTRMPLGKLAAYLVLCLAAYMSPIQAALLIDNFAGVGSGTAIDLEANTVVTVAFQTQGSPVSGSISNNRLVILSHLGVLGSARADQIDTINGAIRFRDIATFDTVELTFDYDSLGGVNLATAGTHFNLLVDNSSVILFGGLNWRVRLTDSGNLSADTGFHAVTTGTNSLIFPGTVDLTSIERIRLDVRAQNFAGAESVTINEFSVVPEPNTFALLAFGVALFLSRLSPRRMEA